VDPVARKRLDAIVKHAEPGAGFTLAMRDLEIRGAGNLLGPQQSGYINAIGFGLYCQLLRRTVGRLKGKPAQPLADADLRLDFISLSAEAADADRAAAIPYDYIEDERIRLGLYRRVAEAGERATLKALREELADRFGPVPPALDRFLKMAELRVVCAETGIRQVETRDGKVLFTTAAGLLMAGARFPRLTAPTPTGRLDELIRMAASSRRWGRATGE
jgi:transcription-repair coupling factor (superfamily II helicase)